MFYFMTDISTGIGARFESCFQAYFPGFESHVDDGKHVPDFHNSLEGFWVETKVGNKRWGPDLKHYQKDRFRDVEEPVVYCLGLHNFDDATIRLAGKTNGQIRRILKRNMKILEVYLITQDVVNAVIDRETRVSEKGRKYCTMKRPIFRSILSGKPFKRFGEPIISAESYYGYDKNNLKIYRDCDIKQTQVPIKGIVLDREKDEAVLEYLTHRGIIRA